MFCVIKALQQTFLQECKKSRQGKFWSFFSCGGITKDATFKSFLHLSYKNTQLHFFVTVLFNIFLGQTLTDGFWGLHKNMNCAFRLSL